MLLPLLALVSPPLPSPWILPPPTSSHSLSSPPLMTASPERDRKAGSTPKFRHASRTDRPLSKGATRARNKVVRSLSGAMIELRIPPTDAVLYAELLADAGVARVSELPSLSKELLDSCEMRRPHRRLIAASGILLSSPPPQDEGQAPTSEEASGVVEVDREGSDKESGDQIEELRVTEEQAGSRVDATLAAHFPPLSRSYFGELISQGFVTRDGAPVKKSARLEAGSLLRVQLRPSPELSITGEPIELSVLHEDEHLIAVDKPAGMVVHPAPSHWNGTFVNALVHRLASASPHATPLPDAFGDSLRPGIVHRLDQFTTGVLLAAKSTSVQRHLLAAFAERRVFKAMSIFGNVNDCDDDAADDDSKCVEECCSSAHSSKATWVTLCERWMSGVCCGVRWCARRAD